MIRLKRAYEPADPTDGHRVLVERLWPRGLRKDQAHLDEWLKDVAPSDALRKWFHHDANRWTEFKRRYMRELHEPAPSAQLDALVRRARDEVVTLVYSTHDTQHNGAVVLLEAIDRHLKRGRQRRRESRSSGPS